MGYYEAILTTTYYNQVCINRFHYKSEGVPASVLGSFALASAMGGVWVLPETAPPVDSVLGKVYALQNASVAWNSLVVNNIVDFADFYTRPFTGLNAGGSGEGLSPVMAFGFRSNRARRDIRRATKRFVGVGETGVGAGGIFTAGAITQLNETAVKMAEALIYDDEGNTLTFTPIVIKREKYVTSSGNDAYRIPANLTYLDANSVVISSWEPYTQARTQNSRQYGRGV